MLTHLSSPRVRFCDTANLNINYVVVVLDFKVHLEVATISIWRNEESHFLCDNMTILHALTRLIPWHNQLTIHAMTLIALPLLRQ